MPEPLSPLVGRVQDLARLSRLVEDAAAGQGRAALLLGDAGVGKTRLLGELARLARDSGALLLTGHCVHGGAGAPYLPVVDALRALTRAEPAVAERVVADHPSVRVLLGQSGERAEATELYEAVLGILLDLAASRPLVLVVEDVHWADTATRDLLGFLLTRLPGGRVSVVLSVRSDDMHRRHPLRPALAEWARLPGVSRLVLDPLSDAEATQFLAGVEQADPVAAGRIRIRAGGNPFFLEQLLEAYGRHEDLPTDLADLVLIQVDGLDDTARQAAAAVAVGGTVVAQDLLGTVTGLEPAALEVALRQTVDRHVLVAVGGSGLTFRHALLAEAVYDDLLPGERARLHGAYAAALTGGGPSTDADLARHAERSLDLATAFAASVRAADSALSLAAPADALVLYERARGLSSHVPDADLVGLAISTADAAAQSGHPPRAVALLREALAEHTPTDEPDLQRAELLLELALRALQLDLAEDPVELTATVLDLLPEDPPSVLRVRALAIHARALVGVDRYRDSVLTSSLAIGMAQSLHLPALAAEAMTALARATSMLGDLDAAEPMLRDAARDAAQAGDAIVEVRAWHGLGAVHQERGELAAAIDAMGHAVNRATASGRPYEAYALSAAGRRIALLAETGRLTDALALTGDRDAPAYVRDLLGTMGLHAMWAVGDERIWQVLDAGRRWAVEDGMVTVNAAFVEVPALAAGGDIGAAMTAHDRAVADLARQWQDSWFAGRIRLHALLLGVLPADAASRARQLMADVRRTADRVVARTTALSPEAAAWVARAHAERCRVQWLADTDAPPVADLVHAWREAAAAYDYGNILEELRCRIRLAEVLAATGDRAAAGLEARTALDAARDIGAHAIAAEAEVLAGPPGRDEGGVHLTGRERQVLGLVAAGQSNRQIGRRLFIADKTVSVHVSNLLGKLGAASRTEAAAIARRDGLLDESG